MSKQRSIGRAKFKSKMLILFFVLIIALSAVAAYTFELKPNKTYTEAERAMSEEDYETASVLFGELGSYRDSAALQCECIFKKGDIIKAAELYRKLDAASKSVVDEKMGSYKELGKAALAEKRYDIARAYLSLCEADAETAEAFKALDARAEALDLLAQQKYSEARKLLSVYDDTYINASEIINQCYAAEYAIYDAMFDTDSNGAVSGMESIKEYKPAEDALRNIEAAYLQAKSYYTEGEYQAAFELFTELGNYKDAEKMADICLKAMMGETVGTYESGSIVMFGTYNEYPIEWLVVSAAGGEAMLVSVSPVNKMAFSSDGANNDINYWLNNEFINAFSETEKSSMINASYFAGSGMEQGYIHPITVYELSLIDAGKLSGYDIVWTSSSVEGENALAFDINSIETTIELPSTEEHDVMAVIQVKY